MELCYLKSSALDTLKSSLPQIFEKYFTEKDNSWLVKVCGENPFEKFRIVPDFELAQIEEVSDVSEIDFLNSKILYKNLNFLTPRQATDERLWAGLCHGTFYDYVRRRWGYDTGKISSGDNVNEIKNRFFFNSGSRERITKNTLSKYWWMGHIFSNEGLDILGAKDFYTKIFSIVSRAFIGNPIIRNGFIKFLKHFKDNGTEIEIKKHIRPAMSELNKRGGAVILDCLTEEEIAAIMIEYVEKISAEKPKVKPATNSVKVISDTRTVKHNSKIKIVSLDSGRQQTYKLSNELKKNSANVYNELFGKKLNSAVTIRGKSFKIAEIK